MSSVDNSSAANCSAPVRIESAAKSATSKLVMLLPVPFASIVLFVSVSVLLAVINVSNVALIVKKKAGRVSYKFDKNGKKYRVLAQTGDEV